MITLDRKSKKMVYFESSFKPKWAKIVKQEIFTFKSPFKPKLAKIVTLNRRLCTFNLHLSQNWLK